MGEKQIRLDDKTEKKMLSPELEERHPALELLDYQEKVRYLVRYAIKHINFEKPIKTEEISNPNPGSWLSPVAPIISYLLPQAACGG